jgi:hypothetical protein
MIDLTREIAAEAECAEDAALKVARCAVFDHPPYSRFAPECPRCAQARYDARSKAAADRICTAESLHQEQRQAAGRASARKRKREKLLADRARLMETVAKLDAEIARLA